MFIFLLVKTITRHTVYMYVFTKVCIAHFARVEKETK